MTMLHHVCDDMKEQKSSKRHIVSVEVKKSTKTKLQRMAREQKRDLSNFVRIHLESIVENGKMVGMVN